MSELTGLTYARRALKRVCCGVERMRCEQKKNNKVPNYVEEKEFGLRDWSRGGGRGILRGSFLGVPTDHGVDGRCAGIWPMRNIRPMYCRIVETFHTKESPSQNVTAGRHSS